MRRFLRGFGYAARGIRYALAGQVNILVMLALAVVAVVLGAVFGIARVEWMVLVAMIGLVLSLELLNTAGEKLVDILSPERDERYGRVKDILAGAVLVAATAAAVAGALIFLPYLI